MIEKIIGGHSDLRNVPSNPAAPHNMEEIISAYESAHRDAFEKMKRLSGEEFSKKVHVSPKWGNVELEQAETIWWNLLDQVHHRGQLTIYLRQTGGKAPSIYGPSSDEPMPGQSA